MAIQRRPWAALAGVAVMSLVLSGCSLFGKQTAKADEEEEDQYSAAQLGGPRESVLDLLDEDERAAVERSGMSGPIIDHGGAPTETTGPFGPERQQLKGDSESKSDKAGKIGISVLSVALSAAAVAAPFFLF